MIRACLAALAVVMASTIYVTSVNASPAAAWHLFLGCAVGFIAGALFTLELILDGRRGS